MFYTIKLKPKPETEQKSEQPKIQLSWDHYSGPC